MENNKGLKTILGALAVLAIFAAVWRVLSYEDSPSPVTSAGTKNPAPVTARPLTDLKRAELLDIPGRAAHEPGLLTQISTPQSAPAASFATVVPPAATTAASPAPMQPYPANRATPRVAYPNHASRANLYPTPSNTPFVSSRPVGGQPTTRENMAPLGAFNGFSQGKDRAVQSERASRMLAPFLRTNRKEQERMDARWAKFSAALDRAVLQALMPKSKKAQMIEKYAAKPKGQEAGLETPGFDGSLAPVGQAMAQQKHQVVTDFGSVFGTEVAGQAGSIMDRFGAELSSALNTPGLTQEQAAARVKEISNKYQKEMDNLSQKAQYDKFAADLEAKDNQQKEALRASYQDAELNNKISQIIDRARAQKLALATRQDLTQQEHYTQESQIDQDTYNQLKKVILDAGQSVNPLYTYDRDRLKDWVNTLGAQEEEGKVESFARAASADETQRMRTDVKVKTDDLMKVVKESPLFNETDALEVQALLNDYKNKLENLYRQELSPKDRADGEKNALNEVNRALLDKQMEQVRKSNAPKEEKEKALAELREAYNNIR